MTPRSLEWRPASTASRRVTGRVVRPDGAVIGGARIRALDDGDGEVLATEWSAQRFGDAPGLEEGRFTVTIPERSLVLQLDVGAAAPTTLTLSAGAVDVDLGDVVVAPP